jgi:hypothetical protein
VAPGWDESATEDPVERAAEHLRGRLDRERLREPGNAFQQQMAVGEQADEQALEHGVLAGDYALDLEERPLQRFVTRLQGRRLWSRHRVSFRWLGWPGNPRRLRTP